MHARTLHQTSHTWAAALVALAVTAALLVGATPARASTTINVTTTTDTTTCASGNCSLRGAIIQANATDGHVTIVLGSATYALTIDGVGEDDGAQGDLDVRDDLTIVGAGSGSTTIDASAIEDRVIDVHPGADLSLEGVTIRGGEVHVGAGIRMEGGVAALLTLADVVVRDNHAPWEGGGVWASADELVLDFQDVHVQGNTSEVGAGLVAEADDLTVRFNQVHVGGDPITLDDLDAEEFSDEANVAEDFGGGALLFGYESQDVEITDSSFTGNYGGYLIGGLGVFVEAETAATSVQLDGVEIAGNAAFLYGGLMGLGGQSVIANSAISDNIALGGAGFSFEEASVLITDSSISGNHALQVAGGGWFIDSDVTLRRTAVEGNESLEAGGLAHRVDGGADLTIEDSTIAGNTAWFGAGVVAYSWGDEAAVSGAGAARDRTGWGSGEDLSTLRTEAGMAIRRGSAAEQRAVASAHDLGSVTVTRSTFSGNVALADDPEDPFGAGGGLLLNSVGAQVVNSTFSGNHAEDSGGAIALAGSFEGETVLLRNVTFSDNVAAGGEGAVIAAPEGLQGSPAIELVNTIAANSEGDSCQSDLVEDVVSLGHNIDEDGSCGLGEGSDLRVDPLLADLADNGGPTLTHALLPGSPALDAADPEVCPAVDQRGVARAEPCDIGAFEDPVPVGTFRLFGRNRIETAVRVSQDMYGDGQAPAVVLARGDDFADALTGTPLAIAEDAPLLLTYPASLHADTEAEIQRVLPPGGTVMLLGGSAALSPAVEARLTELGYATERYFGSDRFATAVDIATRGLDDPDVLLIATGWDSADALAGGAAGGHIGGAVLLTAGPTMPTATQAYLATRGDTTRYALGGPAAQADPPATPLVGTTRFQTTVRVAQEFFDTPRVAGIATAFDYPDALTGGVHVGRQGGPILLSTTDQLHPSTQTYLAGLDHLQAIFLYGGTGVLSAPVEQAAAAILD